MTWHQSCWLFILFHSIIPWYCDIAYVLLLHYIIHTCVKNYLEPCYWWLSCEHSIHDLVCNMIGGMFLMSECISVPHHMAQSGTQSHGSIFGRTAVCLLEERRCRRGLVAKFSFDAKVFEVHPIYIICVSSLRTFENDRVQNRSLFSRCHVQIPKVHESW